MKKTVALFVIGIAVTLLYACGKLLPGAPAPEEILAEPVPGLTPQQILLHLRGDELFAHAYSEGEGLGPVFIQSSCEGCHAGDGKGHPVNTVVRFGRTGQDDFDYMEDFGGPQLQPRAIGGYTGEAIPIEAQFVTRRIPPIVTGLGFLASVHDSTLLNLADPLDADGDGISGRINYILPKEYFRPAPIHLDSAGYYIGRFGKKAKEITLLDQVAFALHQDIGITSDFRPDDLLNPQAGLTASDQVDDPEVGPGTVDALLFYMLTLKAPDRRNTDDAEVISGEKLFTQIGCVKCHMPSLRTAKSDIEALSEKEIHPYTDLLLHDMGYSLDDGFPEGSAAGSEWRTPPLWGLGLAAESQGGSTFYLHDGRAKTVDEAILYHLAGEAALVAEAYFALPPEEREKVKKFLMSL